MGLSPGALVPIFPKHAPHSVVSYRGSAFTSRLITVAREAATANVSARESPPSRDEKIMLRCQTCGSREAMWEWCPRCGNPNPFAWFKRLRAIAVMLTFGVAVFLSVLAYQRAHGPDWPEQEFGADAPRHVLFVRRAGL